MAYREMERTVDQIDKLKQELDKQDKCIKSQKTLIRELEISRTFRLIACSVVSIIITTLIITAFNRPVEISLRDKAFGYAKTTFNGKANVGACDTRSFSQQGWCTVFDPATGKGIWRATCEKDHCWLEKD